MSVATVNPSLHQPHRSRATSKHSNRHYTRVSETNLDKNAILTYLRSHNMHRTLACYLAEEGRVDSLPLLQTFAQSPRMCESKPTQLLRQIQQRAKQGVKPETMLKIQLFVHIWYCVGQGVLIRERIPMLRDFLDKQGPTLAQIPELLPYFALPFSQNPNSHAFLSRVFRQPWKEELLQLIGQIVGAEEGEGQQWLNIISDLIDINTTFVSLIDMESHKELQPLVERVTLYKTVIESNLNEIRTGRSKAAAKLRGESQSIRDTSRKIHDLQLEIDQGKIGSNIQVSRLYHEMQVKLADKAALNHDKTYVKELIDTDVLGLKKRGEWDFERMRLLQMMSSYYITRTYLQGYPHVMSQMSDIIVSTPAHLVPSDKLEVLSSCLDILQKCMIRQRLFLALPLTPALLSWILSLLQTYQRSYLTNPAIGKVYTATAALVINLTMHRRGRQALAKTKLMEVLAQVLKNMPHQHDHTMLEQMVCSTIYLLLAEEEQRHRANLAQLKDILLDRMIAKENGTFDNIVQYTIQRLETEGGIDEVDSDEDHEQPDEYDPNAEPERNYLYLNKQRVPIDSLPVSPIKVTPSPNYSKERYNWKQKYDRFHRA